jgi:hypothetical protein
MTEDEAVRDAMLALAVRAIWTDVRLARRLRERAWLDEL